jgi:hypothetical protein
MRIPGLLATVWCGCLFDTIDMLIIHLFISPLLLRSVARCNGCAGCNRMAKG